MTASATININIKDKLQIFSELPQLAIDRKRSANFLSHRFNVRNLSRIMLKTDRKISHASMLGDSSTGYGLSHMHLF